MNRSVRKFSVFLLPLFLFLIHLPFVFANVKPHCKTEVMVKNEAAIHLMNAAHLYSALNLHELGLSETAFDYAIKGYNYLYEEGRLENDDVLSIVDFSLPSSRKRLFVLDLENGKLLFNTYVAHGRNSGKEYARKFSNSPESFKSSLGFYITLNTYNGQHGYSLRLEGEEKGINDNALSRAIVMHSADYVNKNLIKSQGYIGRSLGCPALPKQVYKPIIRTIKDGSCLFMYSPDSNYENKSTILKLAS